MLGKLLSLLLHAKAGAISGVFLLGATGALVSVSAMNGVTTITITEASASPSASASPRAVHTEKPEPSESPEPSASPNLPLSPQVVSACTDEATAIAFQIQRVESAFSGFNADLMKLRGTRAAATIQHADKLLKTIRRAAVTAIHATATTVCKNQEDENNDDENDTEDNAQTAPATTSLNTAPENDEDSNDDHGDGSKGTTVVSFTGTATSIADQAIAAMQAAFDTAKNAAVSTPKPSHSPEAAHSPKPSKSPDHKDQKGEHHD